MGLLMRGSALLLLLLLAPLFADATLVSGSGSGAVGAGDSTVAFTCTLNGTDCSGVATVTDVDPGCSNSVTTTDPISLTGMNLSAPGLIGGTITVPDRNLNSGHLPD